MGTGNTSVGRVEPESVAIAASLSKIPLLIYEWPVRFEAKERYPVLDGGGPRVVEGGCGFFFFFKASLTRASRSRRTYALRRGRETHTHTRASCEPLIHYPGMVLGLRFSTDCPCVRAQNSADNPGLSVPNG